MFWPTDTHEKPYLGCRFAISVDIRIVDGYQPSMTSDTQRKWRHAPCNRDRRHRVTCRPGNPRAGNRRSWWRHSLGKPSDRQWI